MCKSLWTKYLQTLWLDCVLRAAFTVQCPCQFLCLRAVGKPSLGHYTSGQSIQWPRNFCKGSFFFSQNLLNNCIKYEGGSLLFIFSCQCTLLLCLWHYITPDSGIFPTVQTYLRSWNTASVEWILTKSHDLALVQMVVFDYFAHSFFLFIHLFFYRGHKDVRAVMFFAWFDMTESRDLPKPNKPPIVPHSTP